MPVSPPPMLPMHGYPPVRPEDAALDPAYLANMRSGPAPSQSDRFEPVNSHADNQSAADSEQPDTNNAGFRGMFAVSCVGVHFFVVSKLNKSHSNA